MTLGEHLRASRLEAELGLREMAKRIEISPSYLCDIEIDRRVPSEQVLAKLAAALDLELDDLMARSCRLGDEAERYLRRTPAAAMLLRKLAARKASPAMLQKLIATVSAMPRGPV